jgi:dolichyl-phosphate beta-glucosyltransferase
MLSIIVPSYKGGKILAKSLPPFIAFLKKEAIVHEIIIIDDGSADNGETKAVAQAHDCFFLQHEKNKGKGAAIKTGMLSARGEYCLFTDADVPFAYDVIPRFLYYLDFKEFDIVIGDRNLPESVYFEQISQFRKAASGIFSFFVARFVAGGFFDTQCGIKAFKASVAQDIFSVTRIERFSADIEMLYIALKRNYDIKRLPVSLRYNEGSSVRIVSDSVIMFLDIFRIRWNFTLGRYRRLKPS